MLLRVYFTLSLMYMPSFIAVSVVVFKLLSVKMWQPTYLCFFPLCKLKILPTLRPCNFKSKSQSCLEKIKCKDCDKSCLEIHWESCHCHMTICYSLCGVKSALSCKSTSSELLFGATSALCLCFIFLCWPYDLAVTKCNQGILLKSVSIWILPCSWEPLYHVYGGKFEKM